MALATGSRSRVFALMRHWTLVLECPLTRWQRGWTVTFSTKQLAMSDVARMQWMWQRKPGALEQPAL